jgi:hypothetical protein
MFPENADDLNSIIHVEFVSENIVGRCSYLHLFTSIYTNIASMDKIHIYHSSGH